MIPGLLLVLASIGLGEGLLPPRNPRRSVGRPAAADLSLAALLPTDLPPLSLDPGYSFAAIAASPVIAAALLTSRGEGGNPYSGLVEEKYDVAVADAYYSARPLFVLRRLLTLAALTSSLLVRLVIDWRTGRLEANQQIRAQQVSDVLTQPRLR